MPKSLPGASALRQAGRPSPGLLAAPTPSSSGWLLGYQSLSSFPLLDRGATEAPVAADPKARQTSLPQETVNCRPMNAQMFRQFLDGVDFVV